MAPNQQLADVRKRLTRHARLNLLMALVCPLLLFVLLFSVLYYQLLAPVVFVPAFGLLILLFLFLLDRSRVSAYSLREVAGLIDTAVSGKERFLTLATLSEKLTPDQESFAAIVRAQGEKLGALLSPQRDLPFRLTMPAQCSLFASPALAFCLLVIWLGPFFKEKNPAASTTQSRQVAEELRTLSEDLPALPGEVKGDLEALADIIEESGLLSNDTAAELEEALREIETLENKLVDRSKNEEIKKLPEPAKAPQQPQAKEEESQKNEPPTPADSAQGKKDSAASEQETKKDGQGEAQGEKPDASGKQSAKQQAAEKAGKAGDDSSQDGTKDGSGSAEKNSPSSENKQQNGAAGTDSTAGKSVGTKQEQANSGTPSTSQSGKTKEGDHDGSSPSKEQQQKEQKKSDNVGSQLALAKEKLEQIKDQMSQAGDDKQNLSQPATENSGKPQAGKKGADQNKGGDNQQQAKEDKQQGSAKSDSKNAPSPNNAPNEGDDQDQQKEATSPQDTAEEHKTTDPQAKSSRPKEGESKQADQAAAAQAKLGHDDRPTDINDPQAPPRFTSSGEGKQGLNKDQVKQYTRVEIPPEEKILVRSAGADDGKRYKNTSPASAKTKLGSAEFEKPEGDEHTDKQAIPVEYQDLLR